MTLSACFLACLKHCTWESSWFYWHYESGFMNVYAWFSAVCYLTVCLSVYSKSIFVLWMPFIVYKEIVWLNSINILKRVGSRRTLVWTQRRLNCSLTSIKFRLNGGFILDNSVLTSARRRVIWLRHNSVEGSTPLHRRDGWLIWCQLARRLRHNIPPFQRYPFPYKNSSPYDFLF